MKNIMILFVFLIGFTINAQTSKNKTGPKAKNSKVWENKKISTLLLVNTYKKTTLFGAEFKNLKPWDKEKSNHKIVLKTTSRKKFVTGPKAKNSKPWEKN